MPKILYALIEYIPGTRKPYRVLFTYNDYYTKIYYYRNDKGFDAAVARARQYLRK